MNKTSKIQLRPEGIWRNLEESNPTSRINIQYSASTWAEALITKAPRGVMVAQCLVLRCSLEQHNAGKRPRPRTRNKWHGRQKVTNLVWYGCFPFLSFDRDHIENKTNSAIYIPFFCLSFYRWIDQPVVVRALSSSCVSVQGLGWSNGGSCRCRGRFRGSRFRLLGGWVGGLIPTQLRTMLKLVMAQSTNVSMIFTSLAFLYELDARPC